MRPVYLAKLEEATKAQDGAGRLNSVIPALNLIFLGSLADCALYLRTESKALPFALIHLGLVGGAGIFLYKAMEYRQELRDRSIRE